MERIELKRAAAIGAVAGVAIIAVRMVTGDAVPGDAVASAARAVGGAIGGAFLFTLGAVLVNAVRGK